MRLLVASAAAPMALAAQAQTVVATGIHLGSPSALGTGKFLSVSSVKGGFIATHSERAGLLVYDQSGWRLPDAPRAADDETGERFAKLTRVGSRVFALDILRHRLVVLSTHTAPSDLTVQRTIAVSPEVADLCSTGRHLVIYSYRKGGQITVMDSIGRVTRTFASPVISGQAPADAQFAAGLLATKLACGNAPEAAVLVLENEAALHAYDLNGRLLWRRTRPAFTPLLTGFEKHAFRKQVGPAGFDQTLTAFTTTRNVLVLQTFHRRDSAPLARVPNPTTALIDLTTGSATTGIAGWPLLTSSDDDFVYATNVDVAGTASVLKLATPSRVRTGG